MRAALLLSLFLLMSGAAMSQPVANFTATPTTGCAPMVVSFTSTSTGNPTSYSWNFNNGQFSTAQNPTTSYTIPGTYTVTLTVSNASGTNTKTMTNYIVVKQVPSVSFSASPTSGCPGTVITYTPAVTWNAPGTGTYIWDFGDGGSSTSASPTHTYAAPGTYTVKLTATNSVGCPTTDTQANLITIQPAPIANFIASDTAICALSGTTTFTSTTTGTGSFTYTWDFGDGSPLSTSGSPVSHSYALAGSYNVKLIATNSFGCSDTETKSSYIRVRVVTAGFSAPSSACAGASVAITSPTATPGATISWNYGDGGSGTGATTAHTYTTAGTYTITQTVAVGGCTSISTGSITIHPKPSVSFTYAPAAPCPATVNVQFSNNAVPGITYNWFFGDGLSASGSSPAHWYTTNDTFTVTLNGYNSFGCSATTAQDIIILPMELYANSDKNEGCAPLAVSFYDSLITRNDTNGVFRYPHSVSSYQWNFGDGGSATSASPTHTFVNPGKYNVVLTITTSNGCTISDTMEVKAGNLATPAFGASPRIVCVNQPIHFTDSSTSGGLPIDSWRWEFGNGDEDTNRNPIYAYTNPDTFSVTLHVGVNGCWDSLTKLNYIIVNYPKSVINYRVSCDTPRLVHFFDSSKGATSHIWYFGDGATSTASHPSHRYASPGFYIVSLVTFNSSTGCRDSLPYVLNLNVPVLSISALDTAICKGDSLRLISAISGGASASQYAWWIGTGSSTPVFSYGPPGDSSRKSIRMASGGRYHVALEIKDQNGCKASTMRSSYVIVGAPAALFNAAPPMGCLPYATIMFNDVSTYPGGTFGVTRMWDFGDGSGATTGASSISHPYTATGIYGIRLEVTDNIGCRDSLSIPNYLTVSHPVAIFSTTGTNACLGVPFTFFSSSAGNGLKYNWNFGDGGTSTASSPSHIYTATGAYTVQLIVTDNVGCKDTVTKPALVNVSGRPTAAFIMDDTINVCPPLIVKFTNKSTGAVRYNWSFGTGATSTLQDPSSTYTQSKIYTVRLIATNSAGCSDTAYGRVRILGYDGVLSYSPLQGCAPFTVNFKANNVDGVAGFIYDFGDGTTAASTATTISHVYKKPGPHIPKITLTDNLGCYVTSTGLDTIRVDGIYGGFTYSPFPACDRGTVQFIDTSKGAYSTMNPGTWRFHDGTLSNLAAPSKTYPGPGTYNVTLYGSTTAGCKDTFLGKVIFHPFPIIDAGADTTICLTDSALLQPRGGVSYTWSPGNTLSCTSCENPRAFPTLLTKYIVVGTDVNGCSNRDSVVVKIRTKTTATVSPDTEICSGDKLELTATGGGTYEWSPATGLSNPYSANPIASPTTTQYYTLITRLAACIPDTDYVNIIVHPTPVVDAGKDQTMIAGDLVQLKAIGSNFITIWEWSPTDGLSCFDCSAPEARPHQSTTYIITASTEFNCQAVDSLRITVLCDNSQVFIPNTFTPEGNGVNDVFYPRGRGLRIINHFRIYDRWGELVFERSNMAVDDRQQGWDGKKGGRVLSPDIYVYTVDAICDTGEPIKWQGDVMLLR